MNHHLEVARTLNGLGMLYTIEGRYARAEPLYKRGLAIRQKALGPDDRALSLSLNNLALLYHCQGRYADAEALYQRALAISERTRGPKSPAVALNLANLGDLYRCQGRYAEAESYLKRALAIGEESLGPNHPDVSRCLNNLGFLYHCQGQDSRAAPHYERAVRVAEEALGPVHPEVGNRLSNLGALLASTGQVSEANRRFGLARRIAHQQAWAILTYLGESEQQSYLRRWRPTLEQALSLIFLPQLEQSVDRSACSWSFNGKAIAAEVLAHRQRLLRESSAPAVRKLLTELLAVRSQLARKALQSPEPQHRDQHTRQVTQLQEREQDLAEQLARAGCARGVTSPRWLATQDVSRTLPGSAALIELIQIRRYDFKNEKEPWKEPHYLCFVLTAAKMGDVTKVDLGEAGVIDDAVAAYRQTVDTPGTAIAQGRYAATVDDVVTRGRALAKLLWEPLREHVKDIDHLIISPDGQLCLLPWEVLPVEGDKFLVEVKRISYVGAGRDVVAFAGRPSKPSSAVVFSDPDFDLSPEAQAQRVRQLLPAAPAEPQAQPAAALALRSGSRRSRDFAAMHFDSLPGFGAEAKAIEEPLTKLTGQRPKIYTRAQALEGVFKQVRRPGLLTVHTHGWFLEDQDWLAGGAERGLAWEFREVGGIGPQRLSAGVRIENPLLRCGLALSGANWAGQTASPGQSVTGPTDADDGIATGLEIVGIDLTGTELVVLSACQTGVGEVKIGEGVYGLRRAFHLAGAKSLLVSLWRVPDEPTQALIKSFFEHWAAGMSKADALRTAQRDVMAMTFEIETERGVAGISGPRTKVSVSGRHPYFWAPFILVGDWR